jgi:hypothetical protein
VNDDEERILAARFEPVGLPEDALDLGAVHALPVDDLAGAGLPAGDLVRHFGDGLRLPRIQGRAIDFGESRPVEPGEGDNVAVVGETCVFDVFGRGGDSAKIPARRVEKIQPHENLFTAQKRNAGFYPLEQVGILIVG